MSSGALWALALLGAILDQLLKALVRFNFVTIDVGFFAFSFRANDGLVFSCLRGWGLLPSVVGFTLLCVLFGKVRAVGRFMVLSGAASNLLDRVALGWVVDPFVIKGVPIFEELFFNLADLMICFGLLNIAFSAFRPSRGGLR